jgi:pimeloyl-ACP methyl ester carboxylesterase
MDKSEHLSKRRHLC